MSALAAGDVLRLPFRLFDAFGTEIADRAALNYTLGLSIDGVLQSAPVFLVEQPDGARTGLVLALTLSLGGIYAISHLTHSNSSYLTTLREAAFKVETGDLDDVLAAVSLPSAAPVNTVALNGAKLFIARGDDWSQTFLLTQPDGVTPRPLTGSTFRFALGRRLAASDTSFFNLASIVPDSPATAGLVTVSIPKATTGAFTIAADHFYELEETDSLGKVRARSIGVAEVLRNIPP